MPKSEKDSNTPEPFTKKNIRTALKTLNDLTALGQHPLGEYLASSEGFFERLGERVREELLRAIEYLDLPGKEQVSADKVKLSYMCLICQYVEKMSVTECCRRLGISEPYFHRMRNLGEERLAHALQFLLIDAQSTIPSQISILSTFDLNNINYWNKDLITENSTNKLLLKCTQDDYYFIENPLHAFTNFIIEWDVMIEGRAVSFAIGTDEKHYWISLHPQEKRVRFQTITNGAWNDFGKFYYQTELPEEPHRLTFERYRDRIKIAVNGDGLPIYKRGTFDHLRSGVPTELGSYDMLFQGSPVDLKIAIGAGVNKGEVTRVEVIALNVYEIERYHNNDLNDGKDNQVELL